MPLFRSFLSMARRVRRALSLLFAIEPVAGGTPRFSRAAVAQWHHVQSRAQENALPAGGVIDDQSWDELMLDPYLDHLRGDAGIFAQQALYQRLRSGLSDQACATLAARLQALQSDPVLLPVLYDACQPLRQADTEVAGLLYGAEPLDPVPSWQRRIHYLPLIFLASLPALLWTQAAWVPLMAAFALMVLIQQRLFTRIDRWNAALHSLQLMLRAVSLLGRCAELHAASTGGPVLLPFAEAATRAGTLNRRLTRSPWAAQIPGASAYLDWFGLANVRHYFHTLALAGAHRDFLRQCFDLAANLEADTVLARHVGQTAVCQVQRTPARELELTQFIHPLLPRAAPLSLQLQQQGAFISGQNGVGKSTLLRALGLNLIVARAFGFCYAKAARLPAVPVYSSMQLDDSLLGGESLYLAELRRARELLAASRNAGGAIMLIDEIFRGTNHPESISAAAAVLDTLCEHSLVLVSSHNLVLAALLAHHLQPWCVQRLQDGQLMLEKGVLQQTNGLSLLETHGFADAVAVKAQRVMQWLAAYLTHPASCSEVLAIKMP